MGPLRITQHSRPLISCVSVYRTFCPVVPALRPYTRHHPGAAIGAQAAATMAAVLDPPPTSRAGGAADYTTSEPPVVGPKPTGGPTSYHDHRPEATVSAHLPGARGPASAGGLMPMSTLERGVEHVGEEEPVATGDPWDGRGEEEQH